MIYMIEHNEIGNTIVDLMKKGNRYQVWVHDGMSMTTTEEFDAADKARAKFEEITESLMA